MLNNCPLCLNLHSSKAKVDYGHNLGYVISCQVCGRFGVSEMDCEDLLDPNIGLGKKLTPVQRSHLSHRILSAQASKSGKMLVVDEDDLRLYINQGCPGPTPADQARNLLIFIGDQLSKTGGNIFKLPINIHAIIGAPELSSVQYLISELVEQGLLSGSGIASHDGQSVTASIGMRLAGWDIYQLEKTGKLSGKYGFIAMKFGDPILDPFVKNEVKPAVKDGVGYDLFDVRDVAQAGVIDNIMRAQIRDSAFVLVDLTHDNSGAYWEAGYAEGLGKPVIYLCEVSKFEKAKTHFDTNHCTTVIWNLDEADRFKAELIATLRRSLNLFA